MRLTLERQMTYLASAFGGDVMRRAFVGTVYEAHLPGWVMRSLARST